MDWLRKLFKRNQGSAQQGEYVKDNPCGIKEGMSVQKVGGIMRANGFQNVDVFEVLPIVCRR